MRPLNNFFGLDPLRGTLDDNKEKNVSERLEHFFFKLGFLRRSLYDNKE